MGSKGVDWLFDILKEDVDYRLYSRYLELWDVKGIRVEFSTVLLWRIMAGDDFNPVPPVYIQDASPDIEDHQLARLHEEVERAAGVLDGLGKIGMRIGCGILLMSPPRRTSDAATLKELGTHLSLRLVRRGYSPCGLRRVPDEPGTCPHPCDSPYFSQHDLFSTPRR